MRSVVGKSLPLADRTAKIVAAGGQDGQDRQRKLARTRFYA
ncbi:hypothetical protein LTSEBAI_2467 [Salmonella enterica subsp. enterica serovar Baildon str. R6-199]|nr:hypothetical protein LTSEBAI_2467 [Salmonella enterica subsp. enterica serovar Baildon str. R6-199]